MRQAGDPSGALTFSDSLEGLNISGNFAWILLWRLFGPGCVGRVCIVRRPREFKNMLSYMTHALWHSSGAFIFGFWFRAYVWGFRTDRDSIKAIHSLVIVASCSLEKPYDVKTIFTLYLHGCCCNLSGSIIARRVSRKDRIFRLFIGMLSGVYPCLFILRPLGMG